jgi:hypothetical protein
LKATNLNPAQYHFVEYQNLSLDFNIAVTYMSDKEKASKHRHLLDVIRRLLLAMSSCQNVPTIDQGPCTVVPITNVLSLFS